MSETAQSVTSSLEEQYEIAQRGAGLAEMDSDIYQAVGNDTVEFLNNYNSQDIKSLEQGRMALGCFLTQKGKLVSDSVILKLPEEFLLIFSKGFGKKVRKHLEVYLNLSETKMEEVSEQWSHLALLGPQAEGISQSLPKKIITFKSQRLGIPAVEILIDRKETADLIQKLKQVGVPMFGSPLLEILRIEAGLPKMGVDMGEDNLVAEVGLDERATSFTKGCYLGQEPTARVRSVGHVQRHLALLKLIKTPSRLGPFDIFQGEKRVGQVTSWVSSRKYGAPIALGMVQVKALEGGEGMMLRDPEGDFELKKLSG